MKIKYNLECNFYKAYDEMLGITSSKKLVYRNENRMINNYTKEGFKFIKYAILEFILMIILNIFPTPSSLIELMNFCFAITVGGIAAYYVTFFSLYSIERNRSHKGEILIDEEGILDTSDDKIKIGIPWHYIECVIITDNIICFISKVVASICINTEHYNEVMEALEKYQDDLKVLDKRSIRREIKEKVIDDNVEKDESVETLDDSTAKENDIDEPEKNKEEVKAEKQEAPKKGRKKKENIVDQKIEEVEQAIKELTED